MNSRSKRSISLVVTLMAVLSSVSAAYCVDQDMAERYKGSIIDAICKDGGAWMKCYRLDPLNCSKVNGEILNGCFDKLVARRAAPVASEAEVSVVSDNILSCIRTSFKARYGDKKDIRECEGVY